MTDTTTDINTYTVIVHGLGFWGCGNTYNEACRNAPRFDKKRDYHRLFLLTKPVVNVHAGPFDVRWEWADEEGDVVHADINDKEES